MSARRQLVDDNEQSWMITYADLMTLLLVFFVLLFSISTVEKEQFASTVRSFQLAIGEQSGGSLIPLPEELKTPAQEMPDTLEENMSENIMPPDQIVQEQEQSRAPEVPEDTQQNELEFVSNSLKDVFASMGVSDVVEVGAPKDGKVRIRVKGEVLFESGAASFNKLMMPVLDGLMETLDTNPEYMVGIQGHTDNIPIETPQFPSNWELSAVRATTVLRYLVRGGIDPERVTATGYGDSLPIKSNDSAENRAENRRIEFVLEKVKGQ